MLKLNAHTIVLEIFACQKHRGLLTFNNIHDFCDFGLHL